MDLNAANGILWGMLLGIGLWVGLLLLIVRLFG